MNIAVQIAKNTAIIALIILAFSCNNSKENKENTTDTVESTSTTFEGDHCYSYAKNLDTVSLAINVKGSDVKGELIYNLHEKDRNSGKLEGKMMGDTLFAYYTFNSEGVESIRQVAFLKKGNSFVEGYGESEEVLGKMVFKNGIALNFSGTELHESICGSNR